MIFSINKWIDAIRNVNFILIFWNRLQFFKKMEKKYTQIQYWLIINIYCWFHCHCNNLLSDHSFEFEHSLPILFRIKWNQIKHYREQISKYFHRSPVMFDQIDLDRKWTSRYFHWLEPELQHSIWFFPQIYTTLYFPHCKNYHLKIWHGNNKILRKYRYYIPHLLSEPSYWLRKN